MPDTYDYVTRCTLNKKEHVCVCLCVYVMYVMRRGAMMNDTVVKYKPLFHCVPVLLLR